MRKKIDSPSFFIGKGGDGLISFGSGQPDLPPPKEVYEILPDYKDFKYGLIQGQENLRNSLSKTYPESRPENFVITNGASEALDLTLRHIAMVKPGSAVMIPRPYYYSYPFNVRFAGLEVKHYDLVNGKIDMDNFRSMLPGCSAVLINSPSNPTGTIQEIDTLKEIEKITEKEGIYVISDEVYKDLIYVRDNYLIQGKHVLTINSFSKTFAMCGFRVGYLWSYDQSLIDSVIEMKTHSSMNTNILGQEMAYTAMLVPRSYVDKQIGIWEERRDLIYSELIDMGLKVTKPEGAFYVLPEIENSNKVVNDLYYDHKMICYDGEWFGAPGHVRFSYALDVEKIKDGMSRLKDYLSTSRS